MYVLVSIPSFILSLLLAIYYLVSMAVSTFDGMQQAYHAHTKGVVVRHTPPHLRAAFVYSTDQSQPVNPVKMSINTVCETPWFLSSSFFSSNYTRVGLLFPPVFLQPASIHCATLFSRPPPFVALLQG